MPLLQDALAIHDHLVATRAPDRIVAVGLSLGAGPAAHLAHERPIAGLILVTPFDSLKALAREHYPWRPSASCGTGWRLPMRWQDRRPLWR
jgi:uncharacterized protein